MPAVQLQVQPIDFVSIFRPRKVEESAVDWAAADCTSLDIVIPRLIQTLAVENMSAPGAGDFAWLVHDFETDRTHFVVVQLHFHVHVGSTDELTTIFTLDQAMRHAHRDECKPGTIGHALAEHSEAVDLPRPEAILG